MAISKNSTIDFAKIATEMRATVSRWYNAEIEIVDPELLVQSWDVVSNEYIGDSETVLWSGSARIQPIKDARNPDGSVIQNSIQSVRVQVPYDADLGLIRKGLQIKITNSGEDLVLESLQLIVRSAINSSYGWNRTIECDVDVRSVANG
jgi:hypothetical protein